jgi:site-specific DNA recombinase
LISETDHRVLVAKLTDPARRTARDGSVKHLLVGIAECGVCGAPCRRVKNRGTPSYMCATRFCVTRSQVPLDAFVTEVVITRLSRPDALVLLTGPGDGAAAAAEQARELRARLTSFYDQAADGRISPTGLARIEARLLEQIKATERRAHPRGLPSVVTDLASPDAAPTSIRGTGSPKLSPNSPSPSELSTRSAQPCPPRSNAAAPFSVHQTPVQFWPWDSFSLSRPVS